MIIEKILESPQFKEKEALYYQALAQQQPLETMFNYAPVEMIPQYPAYTSPSLQQYPPPPQITNHHPQMIPENTVNQFTPYREQSPEPVIQQPNSDYNDQGPSLKRKKRKRKTKKQNQTLENPMGAQLLSTPIQVEGPPKGKP